MAGELNPAILPPVVHRTGGGTGDDYSVRLLAPWSSRGWTLRPAQAERITWEPPAAPPRHASDSRTDSPLEPAAELELEAVDSIPEPLAPEAGTDPASEFPWERTRETGTDRELSPWESFGQALKESVTWDGITIDEPAASVAEPWDGRAAPAWDAHEAQPAPAAHDDVVGSLDDIARRMEAFAAELRRVGYPAVTRALSGQRLEAAMASLVAGYVAASRTD